MLGGTEGYPLGSGRNPPASDAGPHAQYQRVHPRRTCWAAARPPAAGTEVIVWNSFFW